MHLLVIGLAIMIIVSLALETRPMIFFETKSIRTEGKKCIKDALLAGAICQFFYIVLWIDFHGVPNHWIYGIVTGLALWRTKPVTRLIAVAVVPTLTQLAFIYTTVAQYMFIPPGFYVLMYCINGYLEVRDKGNPEKVEWVYEFVGRQLGISPDERLAIQKEIHSERKKRNKTGEPAGQPRRAEGQHKRENKSARRSRVRGEERPAGGSATSTSSNRKWNTCQRIHGSYSSATRTPNRRSCCSLTTTDPSTTPQMREKS